jgi:hypothetical protein
MDGNYDGAIVNHWRDPATGTEYVVVEGQEDHAWCKIDGSAFQKLPDEPVGFKPPPTTK